jgi:hypothetical protein
MKLTSLAKILAVGAALGLASVQAATIKIFPTANNGVPDGSAGEFWAETSDNGNFLTFCLERFVSIGYNTEYNYTVDQNVLLQDDPLSVGTVLLFNEFSLNTLPDYFGVDRDANAGLLQAALWMLEDEIAFDATNKYITYLAGIFGDEAAMKASAGLDSPVKALNVWAYDANGGLVDKQSLLVRVPDTASTLALLGISLVAISFFRRRKA